MSLYVIIETRMYLRVYLHLLDKLVCLYSIVSVHVYCMSIMLPSAVNLLISGVTAVHIQDVCLQLMLRSPDLGCKLACFF